MNYSTCRVILLIKKLERTLGESIDTLNRQIQHLSDSITADTERRSQQSNITQGGIKNALIKYEESEREKRISDCRHYAVQKNIRNATWVAALAATGAFSAGCIYA